MVKMNFHNSVRLSDDFFRLSIVGRYLFRASSLESLFLFLFLLVSDQAGGKFH
jgi:hypothetical protein